MARVHSSMLLQLGSQAPEFSLPTTKGTLWSRSDAIGKPLLVMFWCNHCPFVQHIRAAVLEFAHTYLARGLAVVAINSNDPLQVPADNSEAMQAEVARYAYPFAYLQDPSGQVAASYRAACTPDFFVFDHNHRLAYRGAFDRSSPGTKEPVTGELLASAVEAVLARRQPMGEQRPSLGCSIKWREGPAAPLADPR